MDTAVENSENSYTAYKRNREPSDVISLATAALPALAAAGATLKVASIGFEDLIFSAPRTGLPDLADLKNTVNLGELPAFPSELAGESMNNAADVVPAGRILQAPPEIVSQAA